MDDVDEAQIRANSDVELNEGARHDVDVDEDDNYEAQRRSRRDVHEDDYEAQCVGRDLDDMLQQRARGDADNEGAHGHVDDEGARRDVEDEDDNEAQRRARRNVYDEDDYEAQRRARRDADDEDDSIDESSDKSSDEEEEEEEVDDGDHQRNGRVREPRVLWERCDPLTYYNDVDFHRNFRLVVKTALIP
jgi:hypothetical protein